MDRFGFGKSNSGSPSAQSTNSGNFGGGLVNRLPFNHNKQSSTPAGPPKVLRAANAPDNSYALGNYASVHPSDFPDGVHVAINDLFVFTTRHNSDKTQPGEIGLNGTQRLWVGLSLNEEVEVRRYDIQTETGKQPYIGTLNVEIGFRNKAKAVPTQFDQDDLAKAFIKNFESQVFSPTQLLLLDYKGTIFEIRVQSIQVVDLAELENNDPPVSDIRAKGLLLPQSIINFFKGRDGLVNLKSSSIRPRSDAIIRPDFKFEDMGVGGLDKEFTQIFRRAFASRIFPPSVIQKLGISHVKGLLLFGPPGTGKTLIARRIGTMLNAKEPKIVNGPEILSKYVGSSEENIRNLFKDAEAEYKSKGEESSLHIIIFDELDSVFKQRGSRGDGTGVGDNVVNQLLAKMDGVDQLNNILVIGMTNRRDLIDNALLRPGRFEVQVEIQLPDEDGRLQIFEIQTKKMKENKMLAPDVNLRELASLTKNFSGAEIEGLVKSASSFAINQKVNIGEGKTKLNNKDIDNMKVTRQDFLDALGEVSSAFGVNEEDLKTCLEGGIIKYSPRIDDILKAGQRYVRQVRESEKTRLVSLAMHGPAGSGKTALAAAIALASEFPFVRLISPEEMAGMSETAKIAYIDNTFRDSYKSPLNVLVVDSIETIVDWVPIGPRFSNNVLQVLKVYLKRKPPKDRRLLIISTTSTYSVLQQMDLVSCFDNDIAVPNVHTLDEFNNVMIESNFLDDATRVGVLNKLAGIAPKFDIGIKRALTNIETAKHDDDPANEIIDLMAQSQTS
ncbi:vesicle-fusing ATPase [Wickerhamomyces ciferrii]|uniref:Vesicular-fusion protein SEC18 n=1 Tax=Wickerhamomyces ciferrii (strain ATCC 14091 / BCRC 22168 / CBS 111 / JCM 3599 / NBRC 0793 / NRRL Y-1031 F-60-10) TaxID=1206466 RepID=K0KXL6_WICCF|nr:vesicle-fusing ATPase [Wickerhamomyces ciferrii]CCH45788.1 vesicle-fusing ATPase [Wickerhamomyces ciferrii]